MRSSRAPGTAWGVAAGATLALGMACCVAQWDFVVPLASWFLIFMLVLVVALSNETCLHAATRFAVKCSVAILACAGLLGAFGWAGALLALLVACTNPFVRVMLRRNEATTALLQAVEEDSAWRTRERFGRDGSEPELVREGSLRALPPKELPDATGVAMLDDAMLCEAWRHSFVRLEASAAADVRLELVSLRELYLDELVRRHPAEVRLWLASGARAAGNPLPFLTRSVRHDSMSSKDGENGCGSETG
jgi:hypothetical protein